jgi:hypothetical protein
MPNPTTYTDDLAEFIIDKLWEGKTINQIELLNPIIKRRTIADWRKSHPDFDVQYKEAMVGGAYAIVDETRDIVDNMNEPVDSRKVRTWQRLEEAKRKAPNELGDRKILAGDPTAPLTGLTDEALDAKIQTLMKGKD